MSASTGVLPLLHQFGGMEWIIFLIIVALLLLFGPTKLPELARAMGRAWGEFRKGKMEIEREIRTEIAREDAGGEILATRDQLFRAARDLMVPTEARELREIKLDVAKAIDHADTVKVVGIARSFGLSVEGVSAQTLKEQIIRRLGV